MKKYKLRLLLYCFSLIIIISLLSLSCMNTWSMIYKNKQEKQELEVKYSELLDKEETLEGKVVKLQDPEYVAKYAREKYLYTSDGELIIDLDNN